MNAIHEIEARVRRWALRAVLALVMALGATTPARAACPPCSGSSTEACVFACCLAMTCTSPAGPGCVAFCGLGKLLTDIFGSEDSLGLAFDTGAEPYDPTCASPQNFSVIELPIGRSGGEHAELQVTGWRFREGYPAVDRGEYLPLTAAPMRFFYKPLADFLVNQKTGWRIIGDAPFASVRPASYYLRWDLANVAAGGDFVVVGVVDTMSDLPPGGVRYSRRYVNAFAVALSRR